MRFGRGDFKNLEQAEERCFLLTNGLGGYCSLTLAGGNARKDHALFMGVEKAPNCRYHYLTNLQESLETEKEVFDLSTQRYVNWTKNQHGYRYLQMVSPEDIPEWVFEARGITVRREIVMVHEENTVGIRYRITAPEGTKAVLKVCPLLRFSKKDEEPKESQSYLLGEKTLESDGKRLYYETDGTVVPLKEERISDLYFAYDSRDGREAVGMVVKNHEIRFAVSGGTREYSLIYSDRPVEKTVRELMEAERLRLLKLTETAGFQDPAAVRLVKSADQFLVKRESTGGDSIMAGYPFFSDWGRDTMIAVLGCGIETRQFERVKSILRTFAFYCEKGLMPNLFPEGESEPLYNTVDASLWFVEAVYEYGKASGDLDFVKEMLPILESVVNWYRKGTDFHIFMDEDGLISAGAGLEQVTWMDVRYEDILPTSRHGKPVEVNALWYNALCILAELSENGHEYETLAETVKQSFLEKFWMEEEGYLKDVLSLEPERRYAETQIRPNQVWALSLPYTMVEKPQALRILDVLEKELYTPYGMRSLSPLDPEFHPMCTGPQKDRDLAYHQGTVWVFPLGAYLKALLRWQDPSISLPLVKEKLRQFETSLSEGCIGQAAEIYDGAFPCESRGCYAQGWSVGEMLRVYRDIEKL